MEESTLESENESSSLPAQHGGLEGVLKVEHLSFIRGKDGCVEPAYFKAQKQTDYGMHHKVQWKDYEALRQNHLHGKWLCSAPEF